MHDDSVSVHPARGQFQREGLKIFFPEKFFVSVLFTDNTLTINDHRENESIIHS